MGNFDSIRYAIFYEIDEFFFDTIEEYTLNMKAYSEQMFRNATITELERIQRENYFICTNTSLTFLHLTG